MYLNNQESLNGGLAQLGERLPCKQEVTGSIPVLSTKESGTEAKPSEAGLIRRGETKTQSSFEIEDFKTQIVDLISTRYGPIAQLARAHD